MQRVANLASRYSHAWVLLYFLLYLPWFGWLESRDVSRCTIVQLQVDELIPFCEYFVVPYLLWFFYMAAGIGYLLLTQPRENFYRFAAVLFGGMTVCLVIYTFFYTGLDLRPQIDPDKNIFTWMVAQVWAVDTSTNVCPSIHCFATLALQAGLKRAGLDRRHPGVFIASAVLAVLIVLSTVMLKQHSVLDVICAFLLASVMHRLVYRSRPMHMPRARLRLNRG